MKCLCLADVCTLYHLYLGSNYKLNGKFKFRGFKGTHTGVKPLENTRRRGTGHYPLFFDLMCYGGMNG